MTFLQPLALYGLPLALLPVIIHLLNLLRHRSQPWAATRFLMEARQSSSKLSRLKRWLTLLMRVLALAVLALLLSRPMTGGDSLLSFSSGAPEVLALVLDRSASMEARIGESSESKRKRALEALGEYAKPWMESRLVLIDTALREPVILSDISTLSDEAMVRYLGPTDTAANLPATIETTLDWLDENGVATTEIVIASDLQESNWRPEGSEDGYQRIARAFKGKEGSWRAKLLVMDGETTSNASLIGENLVRKNDNVDLLALIKRRPSNSKPLRITANTDGIKNELIAEFTGESFLWQSSLKLSKPKASGWLSLNLPPDPAPRDNHWFFAYGPATRPKAAVKAQLPKAGLILKAAAANNSGIPADTLPSTSLVQDAFAGRTLLLLQGSPSSKEESELFQEFVNSGGILVGFPPSQSSADFSIGNVSWQEIERSPDSDSPFKVNSWNENGGILANASDGTRLPIDELQIKMRRIPTGAEPLAYYSDGKPFLARKTLNKGAMYLFSTLPIPEWSEMAGGYVLVPAIQRLLEETARTRSPARSLACGSEELAQLSDGSEIECVDSPGTKNPNLHAGIYSIDGGLAAINRPAIEDTNAKLSNNQAIESLGGNHIGIVNTDSSGNPASRAEAWTFFLFLALLFLLGESILGLPKIGKTPADKTS